MITPKEFVFYNNWVEQWRYNRLEYIRRRRSEGFSPTYPNVFNATFQFAISGAFSWDCTPEGDALWYRRCLESAVNANTLLL